MATGRRILTRPPELALVLAALLGATVAGLAVARAQAPGGYAIAPGHERFFSQVTAAAPGELPAGWARLAVAVPQDRAQATYGPTARPGPAPSCEDAPLCVELVHPASGGPSARQAGHFALVTRAAAAPGQAPVDAGALLDGIAGRIEALGDPDPFKALRVELPPATPPPDGESVSADPADAATLERRFADMLRSDSVLVERLIRTEVTPTRVRYVLRADSCEPAEAPEVVVELRDRAPRQDDPSEATRSFFVLALGGVTDPPDLARRVHDAVATADDGTLRLQAEDAMASLERSWLHRLLIGLALAAIAGLLLTLPWVLRAAWRELRAERWVWGMIAAGTALRLVLPSRLVELNIGYQLARYADELLLPRYGSATTTLHHLVFAITGPDHDIMIGVHRLLGSLSLVLAAATAARLLGRWRREHPLALPVFTAALALTPMLAKSDTTESNLVPVLFALWTALLGWLALRGPSRVLATAAGLAFVALGRPEMAVIGPCIWAVLARPWRAPRPALWVLAVLVAVVPWQLAFVGQVVGWETSSQSLHLFAGRLSPERLLAVVLNNALLDPRLVPAAVPLLALAAFAVRAQRRLVAALVPGGFAWLYVYAIDLSSASQPRLHIVALLPWSLAAAIGVAALHRWRSRAGWAALCLWVLSAAATVPWLWAATNEDTQERLYDRVLDSLPAEGDYTLALLTRQDAPDDPGHYTQRHAPVYLFAGEVVGLSRIEERLAAGGPVYFFQGTGCYARLRRAVSGAQGPLDPCAAVHSRFELEPVWIETVPNHGNPVHLELGYYGGEAEFEVGLWRVMRPRLQTQREPRGER